MTAPTSSDQDSRYMRLVSCYVASKRFITLVKSNQKVDSWVLDEIERAVNGVDNEGEEVGSVPQQA